MHLVSQDFNHHEEIPSRHTCEGDDISPELSWFDVPLGTKSLALIVEDPDAPDPLAPQILWIHWILYNIPPETKSLQRDVSLNGLPKGCYVGLNSWEKASYGGPCPPIGIHRYFHRLFALDCVFTPREDMTADRLKKEMENHILAEATLMGTYIKKN